MKKLTTTKKKKEAKRQTQNPLKQRISEILPKLIFSNEEEALALILVYGVICKLELEYGKFIPYDELKEKCLALFEKNDRTYTKRKINDFVDKIVASGLIFIPRKGFIQRI